MKSAVLILTLLVAATQLPPGLPPAQSQQMPLAAQAQAVERAAERAVATDSVAAFLSEWRRRPDSPRLASLARATIARLTYRYDDAAREAAVLVTPGAPDDAITLRARIGVGAAQLMRMQLASADTTFRRAQRSARALNDSSSTVRILVDRAAISSRTRGPDAARPLIDSALAVASDSLSRAYLLCSASALLPPDGFPTRGRAAAAVAAAAGDRHLESRCWLAIASAYWNERRLDSSYTALTKSIDVARASHDRSQLAAALRFLGYAYRGLGQYERALATLREAEREALASSDMQVLAFAKLNLGLLAETMRDLPTAARLSREAGAIASRGGDPATRTFVRYLDGVVAEETGALVAARAAYDSGLVWATRSHNRGAEFDMHLGLASVALRERRVADAERELSIVAELDRLAGHAGTDNTLAHERGMIALARGDLDEAQRQLSLHLSVLAPIQHNFRYTTRGDLALVRLKRGDLPGAERELVEATNDLDRYRATLNDDALRVHAVEARPHFGPEMGSVERVIAALAAAGRTAVAFDLAERRRARDLLTRMTVVQTLRADHRGALPRASAALSIDSLREAIPDDETALLEFVAGPTGAPTTLFVATHGMARAFVLAPADSLRADIAGLETLIEAGTTPRTVARRLGRALLDSAIAALPARVTRLLIIPDGVLHDVSFDVLAMPDGRAAVERFAIGSAPSAAIAVALWRRTDAPREPFALVMGDPQFPAAMPGDGGQPVVPLPRLPGSGAEAKAVARLVVRNEVRLRDRASESSLKDSTLARYSIIHLATHAVVDDGSASRSALALAAGDGDDGFVSPSELRTLPIRATLVVLSSCRTARGHIVGGEGVQGLVAPLLEAGARSVVATRWQIDDRQTMQFVERFYAALGRGDRVIDAVRSAKLAALRAGALPRQWAAFGVFGDPLTRVALGGGR